MATWAFCVPPTEIYFELVSDVATLGRVKATYLGGGRHFGMFWIVEGEKEARYCNERQDEIWG